MKTVEVPERAGRERVKLVKGPGHYTTTRCNVGTAERRIERQAWRECRES